MLRSNWIRIPLSLLLLWIAYTGAMQGLRTFFVDSDWSDDYIRSTARIVGGREEYSSNVSSFRSGSYECHFIVEYDYDGETYREEPIWIPGDDYKSSREGDCASARIGEVYEVWINANGPEPSLLEPGNRTAQPLSGAINMMMGLLALFGIWKLWRPSSRGRSED